MWNKILLLILLFSSFYSKGQQLFCYTPEGKTNFTLSHDRIVVKFRSSVGYAEQQMLLSGERLLEPINENSLLPSPKVTLPKLHANISDKEIFQLLKRLEALPQVEYANPVVIYKDGTQQGITDRFFVKLKSAADFNKLQALAIVTKTAIAEQNEFVPDLYILSADKNSKGNAMEMANYFQESGNFEYAEPDFLIFAKKLNTNDPNMWRLWGLENSYMKVYQAWAITTGNSNIKIAILDEGVETNHPDLAANIWGGYDATGLNSGGNPRPQDDHGTHCAGTVAATGNNNLGLAGVAYNCSIVPVRIAYGDDNNPGYWVTNSSWVTNAINYAWQTAGADVLSNSYRLGSPSSTINTAIYNASVSGRGGKGAAFVCAAGNDNSIVTYPANYSWSIAVGATGGASSSGGRSDIRASFGNYGSPLSVSAPGVGIYSTVNGGGYGNKNGTSMACPNTAGVVALMFSANPNLTRAQARNILEETCDKVGGYTYTYNSGPSSSGLWSNDLGYGRVNAYRAVLAASTTGGYSIFTNFSASGCTSTNQSFEVPFVCTGTYNSGNVFTAQLSDAAGSFANPVNIGTYTGTTSRSITATIPAGVTSGTGYRIRVVSSSPYIAGANNENDFAIYPAPMVTGGASCGPGSVTLTATATAGSTINWYAASSGGAPFQTGSTYTANLSATTTYYVSASTGSGNVATSLPVAPYNGGVTCSGGNMFDLTPNRNISLNGVDVNTNNTAGTTMQVAIYYKTGTYAGNEVNSGAWTLHQTITVTSAGQNTATFVPINPLTFYSGQIYGVYINYNSIYTAGTNSYSNADLTVQNGAGLCGLFSGVNAGRMFNGTLYYSGSGCESSRTPVTATITPIPAAPIASYNNPITVGGTLQLSASTVTGASYYWTGPNSFVSTLQNPGISNISSSHAGTYSVTAIINGCSSTVASVNVIVNTSAMLTVSGVVRSEDNMPINTVTFTSTGGTVQNHTTTPNGTYSFSLSSGGNYTIAAQKANDVVANNGLTTIDIVHIRRHLLGVQALGSPYKILAADVNADNAVSTLDIAQMRSLILTITTSFNGQQWKFVPASYVFANPANPFPFNSTVSNLALNNLSSSQTVDFIGLKLGDVNNTWDNTIARLQTAGDLHMLLPNRQVQPQDTVLLPVRVKDFTDVSGYQFTMEWDKQELQFIGVVPAALQGAFGQHQTSNGKLTTTWDHPSGQSMTLADSTVIFQLKFRAVGSAGSVTPLNISSALTKAESYNHQLAPLNLLANTGQVQIGGVTGVAEGLNQGYAYFQNYPNPFSANTTFSFVLPKTEEVSLIIYNNLGQVVATHTAAYGGGEHQLELKSMNLEKSLSSGAYFVSFTAGGFTATKKLVVLN